MSKIALIVGATGLVGQELLNFLVQDKYYDKIKILSRKKVFIDDERIENLVIDFEKLDSYEDFLVADDVFCALGITKKKAGSIEKARLVEYYYPLKIAQMTKNKGGRQFILVSSLGAKTTSKNYYFKTKGEIEEAIKSLNFSTTHILRPSLLLGPRNEVRIGEDLAKVLMIGFSVFLPYRFKALPAKSVAKFMQEIAKRTDLEGIHIHHSEVIRRIAQRKFDIQSLEEKTIYKDL